MKGEDICCDFAKFGFLDADVKSIFTILAFSDSKDVIVLNS